MLTGFCTVKSGDHNFWIRIRGCFDFCHMATFFILCSSVVLFITPQYFSVCCQVVVGFFVPSPYVLFVFNSGGVFCSVAIFSSVSCQVGGCLGFLCANGHIFFSLLSQNLKILAFSKRIGKILKTR